MATNRVQERGNVISAVCDQPAVPASGDPVLVGKLPGVALTNERADGTTTVQLDGIFNLLVEGQAGAAAAAVAVGDIVYYDAAGVAAKINVDNTNGVRFGYALGAVASAASAVIPVKVGY